MKMKKLAVLMLAGTLSLGALTACSDEEEVDTETNQEAVDEEDADVDEEEVDEEEVDEEDADVDEEVVDEEDADVDEEEVSEEDASAEVVEVPAYIANATGVDFYEIYLSVSGNEEWDSNLLAEDTYLPAGHILPVTLQLADAEGISWDLRVVDSNGDAINWYDLDISQMPADGFAIELMWDGENGTAKLAATPDELEGEYVTE